MKIWQPLPTRPEYAIRAPLGDHAAYGSLYGIGMLDKRRRLPPSTSYTTR
jgi:hypothetical protein